MSSRPGASAASATVPATAAVTEREIATAGEVDVVGIDVGVKRLLVAAPASAGPDVETALVVDGEPVRALFDGLEGAMDALEASPDATGGEAQRLREHYRDRLHARFGDAVERTLAFVDALDADVVALEDLNAGLPSLATVLERGGQDMEWILPMLQARLEASLEAGGYAVAYVDRDYTTRACHHCEQFAAVEDDTIVCTTADCPVDEVGRDRSAAVSIARRAR